MLPCSRGRGGDAAQIRQGRCLCRLPFRAQTKTVNMAGQGCEQDNDVPSRFSRPSNERMRAEGVVGWRLLLPLNCDRVVVINCRVFEKTLCGGCGAGKCAENVHAVPRLAANSAVSTLR